MGSVGKANQFGNDVTTVNEVSLDDFDFWDTRYGRYAYRLAEDMNDFTDYPILKLESGKNVAYASFDQESNTLEGLVSTGGGVGTDLLIRILERQNKKNKELIWLTDNQESFNYYKRLGLRQFSQSSNNGSATFTIPANKINDVLQKLRTKRHSLK